MPELPEVETVCRGFASDILKEKVQSIHIRQYRLRYPVPKNIIRELPTAQVHNVYRRAKYIIIETSRGCILCHLGMSGNLQLLSPSTPPGKHDHIDITFTANKMLRFHDPRRFGSILWITKDQLPIHPLLKNLGPEPLSDTFTTQYLYCTSRNRRQTIKVFLMNQKVVSGIGNIYAIETLFLSGIHPNRTTHTLTYEECNRLVIQTKKLLTHAIKCGGSTIKDFKNSTGEPGYFYMHFQVYGKQHQPCPTCKTLIENIKIGQRSTFYCPICQK